MLWLLSFCKKSFLNYATALPLTGTQRRNYTIYRVNSWFSFSSISSTLEMNYNEFLNHKLVFHYYMIYFWVTCVYYLSIWFCAYKLILPWHKKKSKLDVKYVFKIMHMLIDQELTILLLSFLLWFLLKLPLPHPHFYVIFISWLIQSTLFGALLIWTRLYVCHCLENKWTLDCTPVALGVWSLYFFNGTIYLNVSLR